MTQFKTPFYSGDTFQAIKAVSEITFKQEHLAHINNKNRWNSI